MKTLFCLTVVALLGSTTPAGAQINMPNPAEPGASPQNAIRIVVTSDMMVDRYISRWLRAHYPGWDADPYEFTEIGTERYAVVYITSPNNPGRRIYFRVASTQHDEDDGPSFPQ